MTILVYLLLARALAMKISTIPSAYQQAVKINFEFYNEILGIIFEKPRPADAALTVDFDVAYNYYKMLRHSQRVEFTLELLQSCDLFYSHI